MAFDWIIDTGATSHMTGNESLLFDIKQIPSIKVQTASGYTYFNRSGTALIRGDDGKIHNLRNVHLNDDPATPNLMSMAAAIKSNPKMSVNFDSEACTMSINNKVIVKFKVNTL
eukprot:gene12790-biopygen10696